MKRKLFILVILLAVFAIMPGVFASEELGEIAPDGVIVLPPQITIEDNTVSVAASHYSMTLNSENGLLNVTGPDGAALIKNAFALWKLNSDGDSLAVPTAGSFDRQVSDKDFTDNIGSGRKLSVSFDYKKKGADLQVTTEYRMYAGEPFIIVVQRLKNRGDQKFEVTKCNPLSTEVDRGGGFYPGGSVDDIWVLENGHKRYFDFYVRVVNAGETVDSNWNAGYFDRKSGKATVVGFVTTEHGFVSVRSIFKDKGGGYESTMKGEIAYEPSSALEPGGEFEADHFYVGMDSGPLPHPALEKFADTVRKHYGREPWPDDIPTGWNAWASKYHHDLTHENMLENAKVAAEKFLPYGMTTFQIDDGYQQAYGDWFAKPERFPEGMGGIAKAISDLGFRPGIWSQPFCISTNSKLAKEHPDWIAPKNKLGEMMMPQSWRILDPTHPGAQEWLRETYTRYTRDWGYKVLKLDFIYFVQLSDNYYDPDATAVEAYRIGMETIKSVMPEDSFMIAVGVPIANSAGFADGVRLGLDITPDWQDDESGMAQGVKPMVRNLARRYYLNGHVWINHPDMFYLGSPEEEKRWEGSRLTLEEARTYATLASIEGNIVKIGDSFVELDDTQVDLLRRLLPVYRGTARPIDLFERLYPEVWHLPVKIGDEEYHIITLFNWGRNRRWGKVQEESEKDIVADLVAIGIPSGSYLTTESWSGEFMGEVENELRVNMQPRTVKVFALRQKKNRPQLIYTNRHITQGATDIKSVSWDPDSGTLTGAQEFVAGFEYHLKFYCPEGFAPEKATLGGVDTKVEFNAPVAEITFTADEPGARDWSVVFESK